MQRRAEGRKVHGCPIVVDARAPANFTPAEVLFGALQLPNISTGAQDTDSNPTLSSAVCQSVTLSSLDLSVSRAVPPESPAYRISRCQRM